MNTSYEAWARYDVDDALARVDSLEQQEQIERQRQQQVAAKRRVEDEVSQDAEQSAEAVAAHAAVAALKAKARSRGGARKAPPPESTSSDDGPSKEPTADSAPVDGGKSAEELQRIATLLQQKHALIKTTMYARRRGDALLEAKDGKTSEAKSAYESALASAKALEAIVPQLTELQQHTETSPTTNVAAGGNQCHEDHKGACGDTPRKCESHDHDHNHSHDHSHCASNAQKPTKKATMETLPQKDDLGAVVTMFLKDCYLGIGSCEMRARRHAAASEAFKEVLVRDENHLLAWLQRGRAFEEMDAPLLAWLHYNRVTSLDPAFEDAEACEERIKTALTSPDKKVSGGAIPEAETATLRDLLYEIQLLMDTGNVIMIEGFFEYAIAKYLKAIEILTLVRAEHNPSGAKEVIVSKLETTCHVNIASCCLEMQKSFATALKHCELALDNDPGHIIANYRLAQVHRAMHAYEQALESYHTVRMLAAYLPPAEAAKQLKKLDDEVDKCEFERSQYDAAFIRQQMVKEATS